MIGLEIEIQKRKIGTYLNSKEPIAYTNIARIINKPYNTAKLKIKNGTLTVSEAIKIYNELDFKSMDDFYAFTYLFTEQEK